MRSDPKQATTNRASAERRGHYGEFVAAWWFRLAGYRVLKRRWRRPTGEIDLIVCRRQSLVFAEVKYRFGHKDAAIPTQQQRRRIRATAALFLAAFPEFSSCQCRFDLVIINHGKFFGIGRITHIKNAWQ